MNTKQQVMVAIAITVIVWIVLLAIILVIPGDAEAQSCYIISYTEARQGDTWRAIANHWGMTVGTLRAMNRGVRLVEGAQIKIAVWVGCPRP